jgi:hypothetical protein
LALVPWALWILVTASAPSLRSLVQLERFPETGNPGYVLIKLALWVLAIGILATSLLDVVMSRPKREMQSRAQGEP